MGGGRWAVGGMNYAVAKGRYCLLHACTPSSRPSVHRTYDYYHLLRTAYYALPTTHCPIPRVPYLHALLEVVRPLDAEAGQVVSELCHGRRADDGGAHEGPWGG